MKRKIKFGCALVIVVTVIIAIIFGLHWAWKYYLLPEWIDSKDYKTIDERAERAIVFIKQNSMNENLWYSTIVCVGLSAKEDSGEYLRDAWARKG